MSVPWPWHIHTVGLFLALVMPSQMDFSIQCVLLRPLFEHPLNNFLSLVEGNLFETRDRQCPWKSEGRHKDRPYLEGSEDVEGTFLGIFLRAPSQFHLIISALLPQPARLSLTSWVLDTDIYPALPPFNRKHREEGPELACGVHSSSC